MGQACKRLRHGMAESQQPLLADQASHWRFLGCLFEIWQSLGGRALVESPAPCAACAGWLLWVSIDPRTGHIIPYPREVSRLLEAAHRRGDSSVELGSRFFDAQVELGATPVQRTGRGRRDVRRFALSSPEEPISLHVAHERHQWRVVGPDNSAAEERVASLPEDALPKDAEASPSAVLEPSLEASPRTVDEEAGLWQWCKALKVAPAQAEFLEEADWGCYGEEQNAAIEAAYRAGEEQVGITVGVRQYEVVFGPERGFAQQKDTRLRKRRLVRRRGVTAEELQARLAEAAPVQTERGQDECMLCLIEFADSTQMPVVELPECKHVFHRACAQQLIDTGGRCPCCRRSVDWSSVRE
mmetsp:Transcript_55012/g.103064  ORF Transcript_55012/g.103064 Transcript_55012/m.103064 type:complete len:356 (-) Transcript_55012:284-1351(-)